MSQFKLFVYQTFHIIAISCFTACVVLHVLALLGMVVFPLAIFVLFIMLIILMSPPSILQYTDPLLSPLRAEFAGPTKEFLQAWDQFWFGSKPFWPKAIFFGTWPYALVIFVVLGTANPMEAGVFGSSASVAPMYALIAGMYWMFIWFWNGRVERLGKSRAAASDHAETVK